MMIDEAYLYEHMPEAEKYLLAEIPPDEELNHKFSRRFERKMKALIKYERRTPKERKFYRGMKIACAALAVILFVAFGSVMSVKAYRFRIIEFFIEVFTEETSYSVQEENPEGEIVVPVEPGYVPEGYKIKERVVNESEYFVVFEQNYGNRIYYNQAVPSMVGRYWDTEKSMVKEVPIGKQTVTLVEENGVRTVYWSDEKYVYSVMGVGNVEMEVLVEIIRSVIRKSK